MKRSSSRNKAETRNRSHERSKSRDLKWPNYKNRNTGNLSYYNYRNRREPYRRDRSRSRSSDPSRRIDRFRSGWQGRSKSPDSRRGRKARSRSRSVDVKKSKTSESQSKNSAVKKSSELEKDNITVAKDSSSKASNQSELELKKEVEKSKTDVSGKAIETNKNLDMQTGSIQGPSCSMEKMMDERKKCALDMAISMYIRAEDYYDGGNLWCRKCNLVFTDILALCQHLHSDQHQTVSPHGKCFCCLG